jgi:5-methyltetrahydropteroyltriglutamate--homocysteine methyltransferase
LEYDDERSGSFEPLKHIPENKFVVLGLVSSKKAQLERPEELRQRIIEASRFVALERLALSPQCGFASSVIGNKISPEIQKRKLELVVKTMQAIWG